MSNKLRKSAAPANSRIRFSTDFLLPRFGVWGLLLCLSAFSLPLWGQSFALKRFNEENGFPEGYVYTVIQDETDFLWVGTGTGVFRFDGASFTRFSTEDSLAENFTYSSFKSKDGHVWFGHFEGGLTRLKEHSFESVLPADALSSPITAISQAENGDLWMSSQRDGIVCLDTGSLKFKVFTEPFDKQNLTTLAALPNDRILLGTTDGLFLVRIKNEQVQSFKPVPDFPITEVQSIQARNSREGYWIGTKEEGLFLYTPDRIDGGPELQQFRDENLGGIENVMSLYEGRDRKLWMGTFGKGFRIFNSGIISEKVVPLNPIQEADTLEQDIVRTIYQDRFGQVWLGTYGKGLVCVVEKPFARYGLKSEAASPQAAVANNIINTIFEDRLGNFWFGTNQGLFEVSRERAEDFGNQFTLTGLIQLPFTRRFTAADGLPSNEITTIAEDAKGQLWIGTRTSGVGKMSSRKDSISKVNIVDLPLSNMIKEIVPDNKPNQVWIGTQDGVYLYNEIEDDHRFFSTQSGLAHNNIYDIFIDSRKRVWFATHTNRLSYFDGKGIKNINVKYGDETPFITCIVEDKDGILWLGSDGNGLFQYNEKSPEGMQFSRVLDEDGLISNFCYQLQLDRFNNLWVTHRRGFSRYIMRTETIVNYANRDHFSFEDNVVNSSMLDTQGNIWFGSNLGIIRHDWVPSRTRISAPHILITGVQNSGELQLEEGLELPYEQYRIRFEFLGLTFLEQEKVVYQYKLEGRDSDWSEISHDNWATIQGLGDGEYTFQVRARSALGNWNEQPAKFSFSIAPPFWKTWWFRILVMLVIAGVIFLYVKYRIYRLNKEKVELEEKVQERTTELQEEKKKLENANIELERLSLVASETDNAVFIIDKSGRLEYVNPGFTRLTGYSYDEIVAMQKGSSFLTLSSNSEIGRLIHEVALSNTSIQYESSLPNKAGEEIWVISTLTPILNADGELRKIVIIDSNITERKKAEEEVRMINEKLEQLVEQRTQALAQANEKLQEENQEHIKTAERLKATNEELDSFVYRASHDLKGPLASLLGLVSIAKAEMPDNQAALYYLDLMEQRGQRLDSILVDLIEATQVKQTVVEPTTFRPREIVDQIVEGLKTKYDCEKVDFTLEVAPDLEVCSDRNLFRSLLQNYIENSVKYRDSEKERSASTTRISIQGGNIEIHVSDNGVGIPESVHDKVFEMFYRGSNSASGSGLGLYIVRQAVEKLDGKVFMRSEMNQGSTFSAILPNLSPA